MEPSIKETAERIRAMRELCGFTVEEMAEAVGMAAGDYEKCESGEVDFSFTFLYKCADRFGIDIIELLTGSDPHLSGFAVVRGGKGLPIRRRAGFSYNHLAAVFKKKLAEPFLVTAPHDEALETGEIPMSTHKGQEFNYVLKGAMRFVHGGHETVLNEGDSVYYDSGKEHGMAAVGGECVFLAIVIKED
ncbi:MAG: helix-turn-helix domain-containing protein [Thermoplasmatales archaeon]|nr:helix-turn-helix domain-containing protein [Thermoplasmatales archaeon]